jgi:hypothetical protein
MDQVTSTMQDFEIKTIYYVYKEKYDIDSHTGQWCWFYTNESYWQDKALADAKLKEISTKPSIITGQEELQVAINRKTGKTYELKEIFITLSK